MKNRHSFLHVNFIPTQQITLFRFVIYVLTSGYYLFVIKFDILR